MEADPTPFAELNEVVKDLVAGVQDALGNDLIGAYLQGSFAIGDFDDHSDVDFVIVAERELTERQVAALQVMHGRVFDCGKWGLCILRERRIVCMGIRGEANLHGRP